MPRQVAGPLHSHKGIDLLLNTLVLPGGIFGKSGHCCSRSITGAVCQVRQQGFEQPQGGYGDEDHRNATSLPTAPG